MHNKATINKVVGSRKLGINNSYIDVYMNVNAFRVRDIIESDDVKYGLVVLSQPIYRERVGYLTRVKLLYKTTQVQVEDHVFVFESDLINKVFQRVERNEG